MGGVFQVSHLSESLFDLKTLRRVERINYLEVWTER